MSTATETASPAKSPPTPPNLRPARFEDYPQIRQLESDHGLAALSVADWRGLWLDNPLWARVGQDWPIGWVLEDSAGQLVGSLVNIPSLYTFQGREFICANGRAWVVTPEYRGVALWLFGEYFNQDGADLFINTTVSPLSVKTFSSLSARIPLGDWERAAYWITGYRGFAQAALQTLHIPIAAALAYPAAAALRLKDTLLPSSHPGQSPQTVEQTDVFDARFDEFWTELVRMNPDKLLAVRNRAALAWHFAIRMRTRDVRIFTSSRNGILRAYCILKRQDAAHDLRRMRLVDYQSVEPENDLLPQLLDAALQWCASERIHTLEHLGYGLPKMRSFDQFAPYQRKLRAWPFYYKANDPELDTKLGNPQHWDPSAYDGDASLD